MKKTIFLATLTILTIPAFAQFDSESPQKCIEFFNKNDYNNACKYCEMAIEKEKENYLMFQLLGLSCLALKKNDDAVKYFTQAIVLNPIDTNSYIGLGEANAYLGNKDNAIFNYKKAISLDTTDAYSYYLLGNLFFQQKYAKESQYYLDKACRLDPQNCDERTLSTLDAIFLKAEKEINKEFGFTQSILGLSKEQISNINKSSTKINNLEENNKLSYKLKDGVTEANYFFDTKNRCIEINYATPDEDKKHEVFYKIYKMLNMTKVGNRYVFKKLNYSSEVYWSVKNVNGQLMKFDIFKSLPIEKEKNNSALKNPCCCEFILVDKTCYSYEEENYCVDFLRGKVHTVEWGKSNGIVGRPCK